MKKKKFMKANSDRIKHLILIFCFLLTFLDILCQGTDCNNADPFCTTTVSTFPAGVNQPDATNTAPGNNYDCLSSAPNPAWYYLEIDQSGNLTINISNNAAGGPADIDFAIWGPFADINSAIANCGSLPMPVDCSYSPTAYPEQANIPNAVSGQVYIMIVTNYDNVPCDISLTNAGTSTTDCNIVNPCEITSLSTNLSNCSGTFFDITGNIAFTNSPTSGQLIIKNCSGDSSVYNAPFTSPLSYSISNIDGDGTANCSVSAYFSDDSACVFTSSTFTEPTCVVNCAIQSLSTLTSACDPVILTFNLSGDVAFTNPPATGQLVVKNCSGDSSIYNAPFTSPLSYSINDIAGDGTANCNVIAYFSDDTVCNFTSSSYTEPICTPTCVIQSVTNIASGCDTVNLTFDLNGDITFANPPLTGQLIVKNCSGDSSVYNAPFTSPLSYSIDDISGDGTINCTVSVYFSDDVGCNFTSSIYTEPTCVVNCAIQSISTSLSSCDTVNLTFDLSGDIIFINPPSTGQLIVKNCSGDSSIYNAPFTSPLSYNINDIVGDGTINCSVNAYFSDDASCNFTSSIYTEPVCLLNCNITSIDINLDSCNNSNGLNYSGTVTFINPPLTGELIISDCHGVQQVFNPPFVSPLSYQLINVPSDDQLCSLTAYFTDDASCLLTEDYTNYNLPNTTFSWNPVNPDIFNTNVTFSNSSIDANSYNWEVDVDGSIFTFDSENFNYTFPDLTTGNYPICLTITRDLGCESTVCDTLEIDNPLLLYVPTAFKPNGVNNEFLPVISGVDSEIGKYLLQIFNRHGQIIFESKKINEGWNGTFNGNGKFCPTGVYVWKIQVKDEIFNLDYEYLGNLTLIR